MNRYKSIEYAVELQTKYSTQAGIFSQRIHMIKRNTNIYAKDSNRNFF